MEEGLEKREALIELCKHKKAIYDLFELEIKKQEHLCWKYRKMQNSSRSYDKLVELKKIYNCLKYVLYDCE